MSAADCALDDSALCPTIGNDNCCSSLVPWAAEQWRIHVWPNVGQWQFFADEPYRILKEGPVRFISGLIYLYIINSATQWPKRDARK